MPDVILEDLVEEGRLVTLAEVRHILEKAQKDRDDLTYEQKIALEHSRRFARLDVTTAKKLVKAVSKRLPNIDQKYAVRIADLLPHHPDDVQAIFQKARVELTEEDVQAVLDLVDEHYVA